MSLAPAGLEFRANTFTPGSQSAPSIALDGDGDFVIVWQSAGQDGSQDGIFAKRYNPGGVAQGSEFRANTYTTSNQRDPAVAADADGDFVIVWSSAGQDGSGNGVYARRYNAAGVAQGDEFLVNTTTFHDQSHPSVAMDARGNFVVTWTSNAQESGQSGTEIYAQRFDHAGRRSGGELHVNTFTTGAQEKSAVAMDADGDFVVTWQSYVQDPNGDSGIYAQRYGAPGERVGGEFQVNTNTLFNQVSPAVGMDASGDFVIA